MSVLQRCLIALFLVSLGCSAQSNNSPELDNRIDHQVRSYFSLPPQVSVQVGSRKPSEFAGYDNLTVVLSAGERKQEEHFLISKDNATLVRFNKLDLSKDPYAEAVKKMNLNGRPWRGNPNAKVVIVNFDDFQCPFCTRMHQTLFGDIYKNYSDKIKIVYKDFPLVQIHPWAKRAAIDANCLGALNNDAFWAFADFVHANGQGISGSQDPLENVDQIARTQGDKFKVDPAKLNACLKAQDDSVVTASMKEGMELGIEATPTIFVNGNKIDGALPPEVVRMAIQRALQEAGEPVPAPPAATATAK